MKELDLPDDDQLLLLMSRQPDGEMTEQQLFDGRPAGWTEERLANALMALEQRGLIEAEEPAAPTEET